MQGVGDGYFDPKEAYTIEQAVKTLSDIYGRMPDAKKNEPTPAQEDTETMLNNFFDQYYALQYKDTVYVSTTQHIADSILEFPRAECVSMVAEISGGELYLAVNKADLSSASVSASLHAGHFHPALLGLSNIQGTSHYKRCENGRLRRCTTWMEGKF